MAGQAVLERIIESAVAIKDNPGHQFADFIQVFLEIGRGDSARLATLMVERAAALTNADGLDEDYVYLYRDGDINIQVKVIGPEASRGELCANEFDLVLMNISSIPVLVPVYRTSIDTVDIARLFAWASDPEPEAALPESVRTDADRLDGILLPSADHTRWRAGRVQIASWSWNLAGSELGIRSRATSTKCRRSPPRRTTGHRAPVHCSPPRLETRNFICAGIKAENAPLSKSAVAVGGYATDY